MRSVCILSHTNTGARIVRKVEPYAQKAHLVLHMARIYRPYTSTLIIADIDEFITGFKPITETKYSNIQANQTFEPVISRSYVHNVLQIFHQSTYSAMKMLPSYYTLPTDIYQTIATLTYFQMHTYNASHCKVLHKLSQVLIILDLIQIYQATRCR